MDIVFYGTQIYEQYENLKSFQGLPDGAVVRIINKSLFTSDHGPRWYMILSGGATPINISDIPNEVRAMCLIMGLSL